MTILFNFILFLLLNQIKVFVGAELVVNLFSNLHLRLWFTLLQSSLAFCLCEGAQIKGKFDNCSGLVIPDCIGAAVRIYYHASAINDNYSVGCMRSK